MFTQSSPEGDETDPENNLTTSPYTRHTQAQRHYSAIQTPSIRATQALDQDRQRLLRILVACLTASGLFLLVATVLVVVAFQNAEGPTLAFITGVVISVVESLVFVLFGFGTLSTASHEQRSEIPVVTVGLSFLLECLCGCVLLEVILSGD